LAAGNEVSPTSVPYGCKGTEMFKQKYKEEEEEEEEEEESYLTASF